MKFSTNSFYQTMSDGTEIKVNRWIPEGTVHAVIQLSHGMAEHSLRYDWFGSILAEHGFVFNAHDHRGHGKTAQYAEQKGTGKFGYLSDGDGFNRVVDDLHEVISKCAIDFPGKPVILFAHSFGSFIGQAYCERYGTDLAGCILSGTCGPRPLLMAFARTAGRVTGLLRGRKKESPFLNHMAFGSYIKKVKHPESGYDWLTRDPAQIALYKSDAWCGFIPTVGFFQDMFRGLTQIHRLNNIKKIPQGLPVLIMYGTDDPVGDYGKTVCALAESYRKNGILRVEEKAYEGARHELINETNRTEVADDIISWITSCIQ